MALSRRELFTGQRVMPAGGIALPWWRGESGCDGCARCVQACESGIIRIAAGEAPQLDFLQGNAPFAPPVPTSARSRCFSRATLNLLAGASASTAAVSLFSALTVAAARRVVSSRRSVFA